MWGYIDAAGEILGQEAQVLDTADEVSSTVKAAASSLFPFPGFVLSASVLNFFALEFDKNV